MAEFRTCPACGYERGFHIYFSALEEGVGPAAIGVICPSCGQSYDLGWLTRDVPGTQARQGPVFGNRD